MGSDAAKVIYDSGDILVERITSVDYQSPEGFYYDSPDEELVILLAGSARLVFEDGAVDFAPGDGIVIPPHTRHRIASTSAEPPCEWLCVYKKGGASFEIRKKRFD